MEFKILHKDPHSQAKVGQITTAHHQFHTPVFMPVGTQGSVKTLSAPDLDALGADIILGNTYHLYLRPSETVLQQAGGLHKFAHWSKALLTDSGGYQVFSLSRSRKITENGVLFQSHIDGSKHFFTPRSTVITQRYIGADIMMAFDECVPYPGDYAYTRQSMHTTHRWLDECLKTTREIQACYGYEQTLFPIIQGGVYEDLREASCAYISAKQTPGIAIGGLSVGEPIEKMYELCALCATHTSEQQARYLMGVGTPQDLLHCIEMGIDMFDCVLPTRNGRHGKLFTTQGIINICNKKWKYDYNPVDAGLPNAPLSQYYSKAYLRHLFIAKEPLALRIASAQNIAFYLYLVKEAQNQIRNNNFTSWKKHILPVITQKHP